MDPMEDFVLTELGHGMSFNTAGRIARTVEAIVGEGEAGEFTRGVASLGRWAGEC